MEKEIIDVQQYILKRMIHYKEEISELFNTFVKYPDNILSTITERLQNYENDFQNDANKTKEALDIYMGKNKEADDVIDAIVNQIDNYKRSLRYITQKTNSMNKSVDRAYQTYTSSKQDFLIKETLERCKKIIFHANEQLDKTCWNIEHIRIQSEKDTSERLDALNNFAKNISHSEEMIIFHGTTLCNAEKIMHTEKIISMPELYNGADTGSILKNEISVTTPESLWKTVNEFSDIIPQNQLPAGVIFAMNIKTDDEWEFAQNLLFHNVYFSEPDRLRSIITTTENKNYLMERFPKYSGMIKTFHEFTIDMYKKHLEQNMKNFSANYNSLINEANKERAEIKTLER